MTTLFDWAESQLARSTDPETSQESAKNTAPKAQALRMEFLKALGELYRASANEVAAHVTDDHARRESIRKRAGELVANGSIRVCGRLKCEVTGKLVQIYERVK